MQGSMTSGFDEIRKICDDNSFEIKNINQKIKEIQESGANMNSSMMG